MMFKKFALTLSSFALLIINCNINTEAMVVKGIQNQPQRRGIPNNCLTGIVKSKYGNANHNCLYSRQSTSGNNDNSPNLFENCDYSSTNDGMHMVY
eukprot:Pgem_evm1s4518